MEPVVAHRDIGPSPETGVVLHLGEPGDRKDAYFDGAAMDLLSTYLLATACAKGDLLHAAEWLGRDQDQTPVLILHRHEHHNAARLIQEKQSLTSRQRDGVFDMARRFLGSLTDEVYAQVVLPPRRSRITVTGDEQSGIKVTSELETTVVHDLPEFDPEAFVNSHDSLYALSMEGPDSAAPIMTALVGQIVDPHLVRPMVAAPRSRRAFGRAAASGADHPGRVRDERLVHADPTMRE